MKEILLQRLGGWEGKWLLNDLPWPWLTPAQHRSKLLHQYRIQPGPVR